MNTAVEMASAVLTQDEANWFRSTFTRLVDNVGLAVLGKQQTVQLAVTCLLTRGHLLLEDVPGTGKTSLARALSNTVQGSASRIQFTPDLLPSDVTGVSIYDQKSGRFDFHKGPVFATVVLADEINRASPKTQSALLEVMEEGRVTVDGVTHAVGEPFMVVATQNPIEQSGTYRLPEAQLDRFLMRAHLGYPDHETTVRLLAGAATMDRTTAVGPLITPTAVMQMADLAARVHVDPLVLGYIARLAEESRRSPEVALGVSVRGCLALTRAAKTWAAGKGRTFVTPDDVKELALAVFGHRVILTNDAEFGGLTVPSLVERLLADVAPPQDRAA